MANIAVFSSFHRPLRSISEAAREVASEPISRASEPQAGSVDATDTGEPIMLDVPAAPGIAVVEEEEEEPLPLAKEEDLLVTEDNRPLFFAEEAHPATLPDEGRSPRPVAKGEDIPGPEWADLTAISLESDQLGLANPSVISLSVQLPNYEPTPLAVDRAGIYRPPGFRPAPWSGFAYDQANNALTGIAAGTRILTARGEMEVEKLVPGDAAMALRSAALLPISWIGRSAATTPSICIESGALGPNLPRRTVYLGPDQAVYIEPVPVPARELVNGTTIREIDADRFDFFHVDVGSAEVLFAEGLPLSSSHRTSLHIG